MDLELGWFSGSLQGTTRRGFLDHLPTDPTCYFQGPHKVPSLAEVPQPFRALPFWRQKHPCIASPVLPRSSSGISGGMATSAVTILQSRAAVGAARVVLFRGAANAEPPDN